MTWKLPSSVLKKLLFQIDIHSKFTRKSRALKTFLINITPQIIFVFNIFSKIKKNKNKIKNSSLYKVYIQFHFWSEKQPRLYLEKSLGTDWLPCNGDPQYPDTLYQLALDAHLRFQPHKSTRCWTYWPFGNRLGTIDH